MLKVLIIIHIQAVMLWRIAVLDEEMEVLYAVLEIKEMKNINYSILFILVCHRSISKLFGGQIRSNPDLASIYSVGSVFCAYGPTAIVEVTNPITGKTWMDRNLGALKVTTGITDEASYGDLYQWRRRSEGHQCRNSATTSTLSSVDQPTHGSFIIAPSGGWRNLMNNNLWQGLNGVNNPCPLVYRIPTSIEWSNELNSWWIGTSDGAFSSLLKLVMGGYRSNSPGNIAFYGTPVILGTPQYGGYYWSSTASYINYAGQLPRLEANCLIFQPQYGSAFDNYSRGMGYSVRCIKN
jgi:uncharacterized protein (TIGR02145 family)